MVTDYQELLGSLVDGDEGEAGEQDEDGEDAQLADEGEKAPPQWRCWAGMWVAAERW